MSVLRKDVLRLLPKPIGECDPDVVKQALRTALAALDLSPGLAAFHDAICDVREAERANNLRHAMGYNRDIRERRAARA